MKRSMEEPINGLEEILKYYEDSFSKDVKQRGKEYYENDNVLSVAKYNNHYKAKVSGRDNNTYNVDIKMNQEEGFMDYTCNCPCDYSCKHVYAVILALKDNAYNVVELKEEVKERKLTILELIEKIPADELKNCLLNEGKDLVSIDLTMFEKYFAKYLPRQNYKFYYNNLYNALVLDGYHHDLLEKYLKKMQDLLSSKEYIEAYYVCKAVIEAAKDTDNLNKWNELINSFPVLGMDLRIIYRKADEELKTTISIWMKILKKKNYYDCVYLEDVVLSVR